MMSHHDCPINVAVRFRAGSGNTVGRKGAALKSGRVSSQRVLLPIPNAVAESGSPAETRDQIGPRENYASVYGTAGMLHVTRAKGPARP